MDNILIGKIIKGVGVATARLNSLKPIFRKKIPDIDDFFPGTINVELTEKFFTPTIGVISFPKEEIPNEGKYPDESFTFIQVKKINQVIIDGYIVRPEGTYWPESVIELIAKEDLSKYFPVQVGSIIEVDVNDEK